MQHCKADVVEGKTHVVQELSPQTQVSCAQDPKHCNVKTFGCNGGHTTGTWEFLTRHGVDTLADDPYYSGGGDPLNHFNIQAGDVPPCNDMDESNNINATYGWFSVSGESQMQAALMEYGPLYFTFTTYDTIFGYQPGDIHEAAGGNIVGAHAVVLLGWGVNSNGEKYWLLQNSWGAWW